MTEQTPEYITEALQMAGIDLSAPKKIVQEVSGFTPLFDCVVEKYHDETRAAVHGAVWRFCQMEDGVCKASLDTIGKMLGVSSATVMRHIEALCNDGYFVDLTPDLRNKPHVYADGGKVVMKSKLTAGISQRNVGISQRNTGISESQLNKDIKKDSNKQPANAVPLESESWYQFEQAAKTGESWEGRENLLPQHLPLADWYHKATGQTCQKRVQKAWMRALTDWYASGLTVADLQAAYDADIKWRGVFTSPVELTAKAIALKAAGSAKPDKKDYTRQLWEG